MPDVLLRALTPSRGRAESSNSRPASKATSASDLSANKETGVYATLPKALTTRDVLVRCRQEDPEVRAACINLLLYYSTYPHLT